MLSRLRPRTHRTNERLTSLLCFAALTAVLAVLGPAKAADAAEVPIPSEPDLQLTEEGAEVEEECIEGEASEESCEGEVEETKPCPLRSAHAHAAESHNRLKLTIGYTTNEPTPATVKIQNGGTKAFKRRLSQTGVLRFTESAGALDDKILIRIEAVGWAGCPSRQLVLHLPR